MFQYLRLTRSSSYGFLLAVPLLVGYELLIVIANAQQTEPLRVTADVWTKSLARPFLSLLDVGGNIGLGVLVFLIGGVLLIRDHDLSNRQADAEQEDAEYEEDWVAADQKRWRLRGRYMPLALGESLLFAFGLAALVTATVRYLLDEVLAFRPELMTFAYRDPAFWQELALSMGAGLYEEFVFRICIVLLLAALFRAFIPAKGLAYLLAALISAVLFSAIHYIGPYGDELRLGSFLYRMIFGLALQLLVWTRGFGVAAWTHALYDVLVVCGTWDS